MLSGFKNFLVTFLASALLFGVIAAVMTGYVSGIVTSILDGDQNKPTDIKGNLDDIQDTDDPQSTVDPSLPMPSGSSFTFAVLGTDFYPDRFSDYFYDEAYLSKITSSVKKSEDSKGLLSETKLRFLRATWIVLVRADREMREYAVCYFSPETEVSSPSGVSTLGDIYGIYGIDALCEYLTVMTGLDVNYRFVIDGTNEKSFLEAMGSVTFTLSDDIYSVGDITLTSASKDAGHGKSFETNAETTIPETSGTETSKQETIASKSSDPVLTSGQQSLTDYSVCFVNTLREFSTEDIQLKGNYILEMLRQYIERCADWTVDEFVWKIGDVGGGDDFVFGDPYETKPTVATDLTSEGAESVHSMLGAVKYFGYDQFICPGSFSDTTGKYTPDTKALSEKFAKYTNDSSDSN